MGHGKDGETEMSEIANCVPARILAIDSWQLKIGNRDYPNSPSMASISDWA
jgi:hypothetical protein